MFCIIFSVFSFNGGIVCITLSNSPDIVMNLNDGNVMKQHPDFHICHSFSYIMKAPTSELTVQFTRFAYCNDRFAT